MADVSNAQFEISNPSTTRDSITYAKVGLRRAKSTLWIPAQHIMEIGIIEDMHALLWEGTLQFWDPGGQISKTFGFTGEEEVIIGMGGDEDNRWEGEATVQSIIGYDYDKEGAIATILLGHPAYEDVNYADSTTYFGSLGNIFNDLMERMCIKNVRYVDTLNVGEYTNPGMKTVDFVDYMKRIAISSDGVASYQAFTTKSKTLFQPRDHFNRQPVKKGRVYREKPSYTNYRQTIIGTNIAPINTQYETIGITQRKATGYSYDQAKAITEDFNVDDLISKKTFTGQHIPLPRNHNTTPRKNEYTGLRNENDIKGYVTSRAERNMERISSTTVDIPGDMSLEPGDAVHLEFENNDPDNPVEGYHSGKYIIEKTVHTVSPDKGYETRMVCVRNGIPSMADELQLKKASTVKED